MVTSSTTLCLHRVLRRARPACRCSVDAARTLHRELACIPEPEVTLLAIGAPEKAYSRPTFDITATSRNASEVFLPGAAFHRCCYHQVLSNATLTLIVVDDVTFVHFKLYFYSIKITLASGRLVNIDKLAFD